MPAKPNLRATRSPYMRTAVAELGGPARPTQPAATTPMRRLNFNECQIPPSPAVIATISETAKSANFYPDPFGGQLSDALAEHTGIPANRIALGAGSEELLNFIGLVAIEPGDEAVMSHPSFARYERSTQLAGGIAVQVPVRADGSNDIDALCEAINEKTRIVYCASPNNPTGAMNTADEIARLCANVPESVLLVLDEAYYEFASHAQGPDLLRIIQNRKGPWIALRTFSKAYSMAGLRVGYALCSDPDVASIFARIRTFFNVSIIAQRAALVALSEKERLKEVLDVCATQRQRLIDGCVALGLKPLPSVANFVAIPVPLPEAEVVAAMRGHNILISAWGSQLFPDVIRISVGLEEDTDAVLAALAAIFKPRPAQT